MKFLRLIFVHDWRRKLIALVLAVGLWWWLEGLIASEQVYRLTVAVTESNRTADDGELLIKRPPGHVLVEPRPGESVPVTLIGSRSNLQAFTSSQFAARYDATQAQETLLPDGQDTGTVVLRLEDLEWRRPEDARLLLGNSQGPQSLQVTFERESTLEEVLDPAVLRITGRPAEGYEAFPAETTFTPNQVSLIGPASVIAELRQELDGGGDVNGGAGLLEQVRMGSDVRDALRAQVGLAREIAARGIEMRPETVIARIPVRLTGFEPIPWLPEEDELYVPQGAGEEWRVEAWTPTKWTATFRHQPFDGFVPSRGWVEEHVVLVAPLHLLGEDTLDKQDVRIEWALVGVEDPEERTAILDAIVVTPNGEATVSVSRIP